MKIERALPPNFEAICRVFPAAARGGVAFCYGRTIFFPDGPTLPREIMAHERVHGQRQYTVTKSPDEWWEKYLVDSDFRLEEELPAHRMQFISYCERNRDREARRRYLHNVVARAISSPLYGNMISHHEALKRLGF